MNVLFSSTLDKRVLFKNEHIHHFRVERGLTFSQLISAGNFKSVLEIREQGKFQKGNCHYIIEHNYCIYQ